LSAFDPSRHLPASHIAVAKPLFDPFRDTQLSRYNAVS
jgi:hypothetical protein